MEHHQEQGEAPQGPLPVDLAVAQAHPAAQYVEALGRLGERVVVRLPRRVGLGRVEQGAFPAAAHEELVEPREAQGVARLALLAVAAEAIKAPRVQEQGERK